MHGGGLVVSVLAAGAAFLGAQLRGGGVACICELRGEPQPLDRDLLDLLARQLERCGPANLTQVAPAPAPSSPTSPLVWAGCGWLLGLLTAAVAARHFREATVTGTPVEIAQARSPARSAPQGAVTPSTRRALKDGDALAGHP